MSVSQDPREIWDIEREIVLSRVINASRSKVFQAWTDAEHLPHWFGPAGSVIETIECDIREGGRWRFVLVMPDGIRYDSRMVYLTIRAPELLVVDHGSDKDNDPGRFRMTLQFDEQSDGKTVITLRQLHPSKQQRDAGIGFGAVEFGYQTLDKLARHVEK